MDKRFLAFIGVLILIFIGFIMFNKGDSKDTNAQPTNHVTGNTDSKVTLLEYGDYQCPACGSFYPVVHEIVEEYKDKIKFQFRNLPLNQVHPNAFVAARAAEAAGKQGKFWEMYDLLFQNQQSWSGSENPNAIFENYAANLGLDVNKFKTDAASSETNGTINADIAAFKQTKSTMQTPTFFINGERFEIKKADAAEFRKALDAALKEQGQN